MEQNTTRPGLRPGSIVFGVVAGLLAAWMAYDWITDTGRRDERAEQVRVVQAAREQLEARLAGGRLEIVDPLTPDRKVGKVYIYEADGGWEVSGFYRRGEQDRWHAYLASLSAEHTLTMLKVRDSDTALVERARNDTLLIVLD